MNTHYHPNLTTDYMNFDFKKSVIKDAIQNSFRCGVNPKFIFKEIIRQSAYFKQYADEDKYSPIQALLTLAGETRHIDYENFFNESIREYPCERIGYFSEDKRNELCRIHIKEAIDSLVRKGIHDQIIFDSLLQAAIVYGVTITENSNILTSHFLNAISDIFDTMGNSLFPWEEESVEM